MARFGAVVGRGRPVATPCTVGPSRHGRRQQPLVAAVVAGDPGRRRGERRRKGRKRVRRRVPGGGPVDEAARVVGRGAVAPVARVRVQVLLRRALGPRPLAVARRHGGHRDGVAAHDLVRAQAVVDAATVRPVRVRQVGRPHRVVVAACVLGAHGRVPTAAAACSVRRRGRRRRHPPGPGAEEGNLGRVLLGQRGGAHMLLLRHGRRCRCRRGPGPALGQRARHVHVVLVPVVVAHGSLVGLDLL